MKHKNTLRYSLTKIAAALLAYFLTLNFPVTAQPATINIGEEFIASGWMGDGQNNGQSFINLVESWAENSKSPPHCIKITYHPGPVGWAGIYWQNEPDNWGQLKGEDFRSKSYTRVKFFARGEKGGEVVEFIAGGIDSGREYKDSFKAKTEPRKITLSADWTEYQIDLTGKDLSSVIGGFAWSASKAANPDGITFYLDDIIYE